jgi:hypothetical protein
VSLLTLIFDGKVLFTGTVTPTATPPGPPVEPPPPPPPPPPTPPAGGPYIEWNLKLSSADILRMHSGQVASAVLPSVKAAGGQKDSGQIIFSEATVSPSAATIEICISRSRGLIDPNAGGGFYLKSTNGSFTKLEWIEREIWGTRTDYIASLYGLAKAYLDQGPWYVNVRYTYAPGDCKYAPCGFTNQWNFGSY